MIEQMGKVSSSPVVAILGAGAALANPGAFIPIALKNISELDPERRPVHRGLGLLLARRRCCRSRSPSCCSSSRRDWTQRVLGSVRVWLERNARTVAAVIVVLLAVSLLRNGIAGLTA